MRKWTLAGALAISLASPANAQDPRKNDFAYGIAVHPGKDAPLYRVRLPLAVYRGVTRSDLGDLRVFNSGGALVPHELWSPRDREAVERRVVPTRVRRKGSNVGGRRGCVGGRVGVGLHGDRGD